MIGAVFNAEVVSGNGLESVAEVYLNAVFSDLGQV